MKCSKLIFSVLSLVLMQNAKAFDTLQEDTMDWKTSINLSAPSSGTLSSGILKSHIGYSYKSNRNKTLLVTAPTGYQIMVAIRYIDLRPYSQDVLTLSVQGGGTLPARYSNIGSYRKKSYYPLEDLTYYVPNGNLLVTFLTGPSSETYGYDGFELIYTVQGIPGRSQCHSNIFTCDNGRCISRKLQCDGYNHCGDRSSERNCFTPGSRPGRVIGIVSGCTFLLIAVICGIYVVRRRRFYTADRQTVITSHPPPTTNLPSYPPVYPYSNPPYPPPPPPYSQGVTNPTYH